MGQPVLFILLKLAALAGLAVTLTMVSAIYSTTAQGGMGWGQRVFWMGVAALVLFGVGRAMPQWDKGLTLMVLGGSLIAPAVLLGMQVSTWREHHARRRKQEAVLDRALAPGHLEELAAFLQRPVGDDSGLTLRTSDIERIERSLSTVPPEELRAHHLAERLLLGIELRPNPRSSLTETPPEVLEALCRLYPKLKERSGFSPAQAPFYLRQRDRAVSRVAELGRTSWLEEIHREHPGFQAFTEGASFADLELDKWIPTRLAPGERVVSRSLGSLPLHVLIEVNVKFFRPAPQVASDLEAYPDSARRALNETHRALALLKSRGVDFTEEELRDEGLQAFLETVRAATPAP